MEDFSQFEQPAPKGRRNTAGTQSVDRALLLLRLVGESQGPSTLQSLCENSGLNRTTTWRLLACLERNRFLDRDPLTKTYDLGPAAMRMCAIPQRRNAPLIRMVLPELEALMRLTQESCLLSVPCAGGTITLVQVDPPRSVRLKDYTSQVTPLWGTSTGKVLLSLLSDVEFESILGRERVRFTPYTIVEEKALRAEIARVRLLGYATVEGEWSEEENGLTAPIIAGGEPVGLLGVGGPRNRFLAGDMERAAPALCAACRRLEKQLT